MPRFALKAFPDLAACLRARAHSVDSEALRKATRLEAAVFGDRYPRFSTDRETAEKNNLEWVTPGHPLFEAIRRHTLSLAQEPFGKGACFYSLQHEHPARIDFYRARVVDGLGDVIHERLFAWRFRTMAPRGFRSRALSATLLPRIRPSDLPAVAATSRGYRMAASACPCAFSKRSARRARLPKSTASPTT